EHVRGLRARGEAERDIVRRIKKLKEERDRLRAESERAQRDANYQRAAELRYGRIPAVEKQIEELQGSLRDSEQAGTYLREEVTPDDIAAVVSRWTGIPVTKMLESESQKLLGMEDRLR